MKDLLREGIVKLDIIKSLAAFTIMAALLMIVFSLIRFEIPEKNKEALIHVLGIIEGAMIAIISFYFGSSKGEQKSHDLLKPPIEIKKPDA